jgi:ADP-ribosylglycohydrolase
MLNSHNDPENAIIRCAMAGGDADTTSCILAAQLGALHGTRWIPARWWNPLKDIEPSITEIAERFTALDITEYDATLNERKPSWAWTQ